MAASFHGKTESHTKGTYNPIYNDARSGQDFIHNVIAQMFERGKLIAEDNAYPENLAAEYLRKQADVEKDSDKKKALLEGAEKIDIPYNWKEVPVLGFNSSKFDLNLILKFLDCKNWHVCDEGLMIGGVSAFKKIRVKHVKSGIILVFLDAKNFVAGGSLADFVKNFGDGKESKSMMAYEAFDITNYEKILNSTEPFTKEQFKSVLRKSPITEKKYQQYLIDWESLKKAHKGEKEFTRWDYLKYYNINDVEIMKTPMWIVWTQDGTHSSVPLDPR
jgi:hypothetical protein